MASLVHAQEIPTGTSTAILEFDRGVYDKALSKGLPKLDYASKTSIIPGLKSRDTQYVIITAGPPSPDANELEVIRLRREVVKFIEGVTGEFAVLVVYGGMDPELIDRCLGFASGIIIPGGEDLDHSLFEKARDASAQRNLVENLPEKDRLELTLVAWALKNDIPILGICRGFQVLAAIANRRVDDIPPITDETETQIRHTDEPQSYEQLLNSSSPHRISMRIEDVMRLSRSLDGLIDPHSFAGGEIELEVTSMHHQGIGGVNEDVDVRQLFGISSDIELEVIGTSEDGMPEVIILKRHGTIAGFGFQGHPEVGRLEAAADTLHNGFYLAYVPFSEAVRSTIPLKERVSIKTSVSQVREFTMLRNPQQSAAAIAAD